VTRCPYVAVIRTFNTSNIMNTANFNTDQSGNFVAFITEVDGGQTNDIAALGVFK
jgi:hypothetical protein